VDNTVESLVGDVAHIMNDREITDGITMISGIIFTVGLALLVAMPSLYLSYRTQQN
jgi:hypothetical protein